MVPIVVGIVILVAIVAAAAFFLLGWGGEKLSELRSRNLSQWNQLPLRQRRLPQRLAPKPKPLRSNRDGNSA